MRGNYKQVDAHIRLMKQTEHSASTFLRIANNSFINQSPWTLNQFEEIVKQPHVFVLTAQIQNEVVGFLCGSLNPFEGEIYNLAIVKKYQRLGLATRLIDEMKRMLKVKNLKSIFLEARKSNKPAIKLYEKTGFKIVGSRKAYYKYPKEDALILKFEEDKR